MNNDLISRAAAINAVNAYDYRGISLRDVRTVTDGCANEIRRLPAIDAEPVRHGRWIPKKVDAIVTKFQCSDCGRTVECGNDYFGKPPKYVSSTFPYCHCGAKMDGESECSDG